jgi:hypothetical protein
VFSATSRVRHGRAVTATGRAATARTPVLTASLQADTVPARPAAAMPRKARRLVFRSTRAILART